MTCRARGRHHQGARPEQHEPGGVLEDRDINPEELPPEEDLKKLERRMKIQCSPDLEYPYCRKYPW